MIDTLNVGSCGEWPSGPSVCHLNIDRDDLLAVSPQEMRVQADAQRMPFATNTFRHVQGNNLPGDSSFIRATLRESYRVLVANGLAVFSSGTANIPAELAAAGFREIDIRGLASRGTIYGRLTRPAVEVFGFK
jgi:ubiquinone/menaquinone biosynthesis C-methylase UbiE